jgi:hypothetical protein
VSSLIWRYPPLANVLQALKVETTITDACAHYTKKFGERHLKHFKIVSLGTWVLRVNQRCRCPGGVHIPLMERSESGAVSGTAALKASQAYPVKFGESVVAAWLAGDIDPSELVQSKKPQRSKRTIEDQPASRDDGGQASSSAAAGAASWLRPAAGKHARKAPGGSAKSVAAQPPAPSWARPAPP